MKIGALRRIDNLGRIVIPLQLEKLKNISNILKNTLEEIIKKEVYITDREKIIIPSIKNPNLKEEIIEMIESRKTTIKKEEKKNKENITTIIPIIVNGDIYGSAMIISNKLLTELWAQVHT